MSKPWKRGEWYTEFRVYDSKDNHRLVGTFVSIFDTAHFLNRSVPAIQSAIQRKTFVGKQYLVVKEKVYENEKDDQ